MLAILAQGPSASPAEIGTWLLVFSLLASIIGNVAGVLRGGRTKTELTPQPIQVELAQKFQSRESAGHQDRRIDAVERRIDKVELVLGEGFGELRDVIAKGQAMDEERARRIHQRIDALAVSLAEKIGTLHGQINPPNQRCS